VQIAETFQIDASELKPLKYFTESVTSEHFQKSSLCNREPTGRWRRPSRSTQCSPVVEPRQLLEHDRELLERLAGDPTAHPLAKVPVVGRTGHGMVTMSPKVGIDSAVTPGHRVLNGGRIRFEAALKGFERR